MATIMCLPDEMIEIILSYDDISNEDMDNFRFVWKELHPNLSKCVEPWERIFFQRWPSVKEFYDNSNKKNETMDAEKNEQNNERNLLDFIETGINCARELRDCMSRIIYKHYHKHYYDIDNLTQFKDVFHIDEYLTNKFDEIIDESEPYIKYHYFIDEIVQSHNQYVRRTDCDLTVIYCYYQIFYYIKQRSLKKEWYTLEEQPEKQILEQIVTIIAQSVKPEKEVYYLYVKTSLDNMALEVMDYLRDKHPNHSIFSTSPETLIYWRNNNIDENYWNETEGIQIMEILEEYIFGKIKFQYRFLSLNNLNAQICIDDVLKYKFGVDLIILIIYHSVARRLGLRCDVVKLYNGFMNICCIFWKPKHYSKGLQNARCFRITFKDNGKAYSFPYFPVNSLPDLLKDFTYFRHRKLQKIKPIKIWCALTSLIYENCGSISSTFFEMDPNYYAGGVLKLRFNNPDLTNVRLNDVKYAVGMIVEHRDRNEYNIGVIIAWFRYANRHVVISKDFDMTSMNIVSNNLPVNICALELNDCLRSTHRREQTNYIILDDDNKMTHAKEGDITLTSPKWIQNREIGRYFCKFEGTHYVPNQMLARLFPEDAAITAETMTRYQNNRINSINIQSN